MFSNRESCVLYIILVGEVRAKRPKKMRLPGCATLGSQRHFHPVIVVTETVSSF